MDLPTPEWIQKWCDAHGGGWAIPTALSQDHPIVVEGWLCFGCEQPIQAHHVVIIMPLSIPVNPRWIAEHRECMLHHIGAASPTAFIDPLPDLLSKDD